MVAPKEQALSCVECHTRNDGRLANLSGFYLPGRDSNEFLDKWGLWLFILTVLGVFGHALIRIGSNIYFNKYDKQVIDYQGKDLRDDLSL
jgi:hypothetical protein